MGLSRRCRQLEQKFHASDAAGKREALLDWHNAEQLRSMLIIRDSRPLSEIMQRMHYDDFCLLLARQVVTDARKTRVVKLASGRRHAETARSLREYFIRIPEALEQAPALRDKIERAVKMLGKAGYATQLLHVKYRRVADAKKQLGLDIEVDAAAKALEEEKLGG